MHFAGFKAAGESQEQSLADYDNNVSITLCQTMAVAGVFQLAFSSSATVYGDPLEIPISESYPTGQPTNPYGRSKPVVEQILQDLASSDSRWSIGLLCHFNPVGAHPGGLIGENPNGVPNNLRPYISQVVVGRLPQLAVFGNDYPTPDGTGGRDYIHVVDLAQGHLAALDYISRNSGAHVWNPGTGVGYSVLEMIEAFEQYSGRNIPYRIAPRHSGDITECRPSPAKALRELGWKAERGLKK